MAPPVFMNKYKVTMINVYWENTLSAGHSVFMQRQPVADDYYKFLKNNSVISNA